MNYAVRKEKSKPRIVLGPLEVSGYYGNLVAGFNGIGVEARFISNIPHPFEYEEPTRNPYLARRASAAFSRFHEKNGLGKVLALLDFGISSTLLVFWLLPKFDVFIAAWGKSYMPLNIDLILFRLAGKQIIVNLGHGSEARPPYMAPISTGKNSELGPELRKIYVQTKRTRAKVQFLESIAHKVVGLGTTGHFLKHPFFDFYRLGIPTRAADGVRLQNSKQNKNLLILHLPSKPELKGTKDIEIVMRSLAKIHSNIDFQIVTKVSHEEALAKIAKADLVIDQLWSDIPMAVVSTEAASLGVPSLIGGYAWDYWRGWAANHGNQFLPPSILIEPERMRETLEKIIEGKIDLATLSKEQEEFVQKVWNPSKVAENYLALIKGESPANWLIHPETINYPWGIGRSKTETLKLTKLLYERYGVKVFAWTKAKDFYIQN